MALRSVRLFLMCLLAGALAGCTGSGSPGVATPTVVPSTTPVEAAATCPPGSAPNALGPAHQARPWESDAAAFDRQSGVVVFDDSWTFDVCNNTWQKVTTRGEGPTETTALVYDPVDDLTYAISSLATIRFYDVETSTWASVGQPRGLRISKQPDLFVMDPIDGVIYGYQLSTGQMQAYDIARNIWTEVEQRWPLPPTDWWAAIATFDPTVGRIVLYGLRPNEPEIAPRVERSQTDTIAETWTFDPDAGAWKRRSTRNSTFSSYSMDMSGIAVTYNEASRSTVLVADNRVAMFDATANRWRVPQRGSGWPDLTRVQGLVDDAVNGRVLVLGGSVPAPESQGQSHSDTSVWAYDVAANTWTELVPPLPN